MRHFDLCILGSGSGNAIPDERFADQRIALVEKGVFGGTCLNVGCIPTKMLVYPADLAASPAKAAGLGVDLALQQVHWGSIRDRVFGRIDPISVTGEQGRAASDNLTLFRSAARFTGPYQLDTGTGEAITADRFVIATGSHPVVPEFPGLKSVRVHTSDTVMRLDERPATMMIIGGGYVASEFSHIFSAFGTEVTVVARSDRLLGQHDADVATRFTELLGERVRLLLETSVERLAEHGGQTVVTVRGKDGGRTEIPADVVLVATGRAPNSAGLNLAATGVEVAPDGAVIVDEYQRTTALGIFALGDVSSPYPLKHAANHEMRVVQHNLLHPDAMRTADHRFVPSAVFSSPQVATVGLTEEQARERKVPFVTAVQEYRSVAYGWAMEDHGHFCKLLADPATGQLLGAHLIGPQASVLIQPLIQAMSFGLPAAQMARGQYWIHPALTEVVENALLALPLANTGRPDGVRTGEPASRQPAAALPPQRS